MQVDDQLLKVLIVDDEPYIRKGLAVLIDWEAEGLCIAGEASNGKSAIQLLKENEYDLILSDIKMPEMDGVEFITYIRDNNISSAKFVFLSGYYDFSYAKAAIQLNCCDYILKPIVKEELLVTLRRIVEDSEKEAKSDDKKKDYEKAYLDRHLISIIYGKYDCVNLQYVQDKVKPNGSIAYLHCEISLNDEKFLALTEDNRIAQQRKLYNYGSLLLRNYTNHIVFDAMKHTQCYDIGIIFCDSMFKDRGITQEEWLSWLVSELTERVGYEIVCCMGSKVDEISAVSDSYREVVMLSSFRFHKKNENKASWICKKEVESKCLKTDEFRRQSDDLVHAIEIHDKYKVKENAIILYRSMMERNVAPEEVSRCIQYLLYRLLGLTYNQDAEVDQEEIMKYIREAVFTSETNYENSIKFQQFALEYSDYLAQLRCNCAKGTINLIEAEIEKNFADNISLKTLGEKYYTNSAYLGQLFKKQFGCSFKDYLNNVRIRNAAEMILNTDKKIYEIAVDVGYKSRDYFINKFEEVYGITPAKFRKNSY